MKKLTIIASLLLIILSSCTRVGPGYVGFKYDYAGGNKGKPVTQDAIGYTTFMPGFSTVISFPTFQQHWEGSINIFCKLGAGFNCPIGYNYSVDPNRAAEIYFKYKTDDLQTITDKWLLNTLRNTMNEVSGGITLDSFITNTPAYRGEVERRFIDSCREYGFIVSQYGFTGTPEPTDNSIKTAIHAKIAAKQNAETKQQELLSSQADANKEIAQATGHSQAVLINAKTEAEAIRLKQSEVTPTYVEYIKWSSWNGVLPTTMLGNNTSVLMNK